MERTVSKRRGQCGQDCLPERGTGHRLVMLAEVIFERSYDNFLPGLKETYRVEERYKQKDTDWREHAQTPGAIGPGLQRYCPAVEVATVLRELGR